MDAITRMRSITQRNWPHLDRAGTLTASWALAGGLAGGVLVAGLLAAGLIHPSTFPVVAPVMAAVGSGLGFVHGAVLGYLSRPAGRPAGTRWSERVMSLVVVMAAVVLAILEALWLGLSAAVARSGSLVSWGALLISAPVALGIFAWATVLGWHALEDAYSRWPDHRLGTWLVLGAFAVLIAVFLALRPAIPGTELRPSTLGLVILAVVATLWVAAPAIIVGLRLMRGRKTGPGFRVSSGAAG